MVDFRRIEIEDKEIFEKYIKYDNHDNSEMTFTNFFMWRKQYKFKYSIIFDYLCVISENENDFYSMFPIGNVDSNLGKVIEIIKDYFYSRYGKLVFNRMNSKNLSNLKSFYDLKDEQIEYSRDNSDYIYLVDNMINLKGKKYHSKRNHINKFKSLYEYSTEIIDKENLKYCYDIVQKWCDKRKCNDNTHLTCEKKANFELLDNYEKLGCNGIVIRVNGTYEAFSVGEILNPETWVIHIEKADSEINGLYSYINYKYCKELLSEFKYVNREQDLGIDGLRKAKMSYLPHKFVDKYTVIL